MNEPARNISGADRCSLNNRRCRPIRERERERGRLPTRSARDKTKTSGFQSRSRRTIEYLKERMEKEEEEGSSDGEHECLSNWHLRGPSAFRLRNISPDRLPGKKRCQDAVAVRELYWISSHRARADAVLRHSGCRDEAVFFVPSPSDNVVRQKNPADIVDAFGGSGARATVTLRREEGGSGSASL